jgi:hypothetical protein
MLLNEAFVTSNYFRTQCKLELWYSLATNVDGAGWLIGWKASRSSGT